jgi:hypothetical protein
VIEMILKILVLVASIAQVVGAAFLSIGTFQDAIRALPVFIQPAGWAFSIWGLIYTLSFIYAVYQIIPKYDNALLKQTRLPALLGFSLSIVWLFFAGMSNVSVWLTIPILFAMAGLFVRVVHAEAPASKWQTIFSKDILLPYAAWTGIAAWVNVQALLVDQAIITSPTINILSNLVLFVGLASFTLFYFKKTNYSAWYGGIMIWAGTAVVFANVAEGSLWFAALATLFTLMSAALTIRALLKP